MKPASQKKTTKIQARVVNKPAHTSGRTYGEGPMTCPARRDGDGSQGSGG